MAKKSKRVLDLEAKVLDLEAKLAEAADKLALKEAELIGAREEIALLSKPTPKSPVAKNGSRKERDAEVTRLAAGLGLTARQTGNNTWQIDGPEGQRGTLDYFQNRKQWEAHGGKLDRKHAGTLESLLDLLAYPAPPA